MRNTTLVAAWSLIVFALAGVAWFVVELSPQNLGFEDTDNPAVMLRFIRAYPDVFVYSGIIMIVMAICLTVAILAVADGVTGRSDPLALRCVSAFGLFTAAFFFVNAAVHIGASGPLRHMAGLKEEWGEAAYLTFQVTSQALLIMGLFTLSLWAVGHSLIGLRTKVIPVALCALGILPAFRLVGGILGPLGLMPEGLWILGVISIPGVFLWCLLLGVVLLRYGFRSAAAPLVDPARVAA